MLKFNDSFAWSATKGICPFFISQITSGPGKTQPPMADGRQAAGKARTGKNIAHCRSSCTAGRRRSAAAVGRTRDQVHSGTHGRFPGTAAAACPRITPTPIAEGQAPPQPAPYGHASHQDRAGAGCATVDRHRHRPPRSPANIAFRFPAMVMPSTGIGDLAAFDPEPGRTARIVAGDRIPRPAHQSVTSRPRPSAASRRSHGIPPSPAGCTPPAFRGGRKPNLRAGNCRARTAGRCHRAPAAIRGWPRLRHQTRRAPTARRNGSSSMPNQSGNTRVPALSSRKLALRYNARHGHRADVRTDQRARHLRMEQHRHFARRQLKPRIQPFQRALRRLRPGGVRIVPRQRHGTRPSRCIASPSPAICAQPR